MKATLFYLFILPLYFISNTISSQNVYVPDDLFEQALIDLGYDDVLDDYVLQSNIENVTSLSLNGKQIADLTGIEAFSGLIDLDVSNNGLNSINISNLKNLVTINLKTNNISGTIDFSENSKLESINAGHNKLETLDLSKNTELLSLDLSFNQFSTIDLSYNTKLTYLNLAHRSRNISGGGGLSNITFSNLTLIDISKNTLLQYLNLDNNLISTIDLSQNINLTEIYFSYNYLTSIDVSTNLMLNTLRLSDNDLTSLNINMLEALINLSSKGNNLSCISVFNVEFANQNWRTSADTNTLFLNNCDDLVYVPDNLFEQKLIDLGYDDVLDDYILKPNVENVTSLNLDYINIDDLTGLEAFTNLESLSIIDLSIDVLDLSKNTKLKTVNCADNLLSSLDITQNILLEELIASTNSFTNLDISKNVNLKKIDLNYNQLTSIDVTNNLQLKEINVLNSSLTTIDFTQNTLLEIVELQGNQLTTLDVSQNINLLRLFVPNNLISDIDVSQNLLLQRLSVSNNNLSSLNLKINEQLQFLYTDGNNLNCVSVFDVDFANANWKIYADANTIFTENCEDLVYVPDNLFEQKLIDLGYDDVLDDYVLKTNVENVTTLNLDNINIDILTGLEAFTNLESLSIIDLSIDVLDVSKNTKLKTVNCADNLLSSLDITQNILLEELIASTNRFTNLDISKNVNLIKLDLNYNQLTSIDVTNNLQLKEVNILNSSLTNIDVTQNSLLEIIELQGNQLTALDVSQNLNLLRLSFPNNLIGDIDVSQNLLLQRLSVSNNNLSKLDLKVNEQLLFLYTSGNNLNCVTVFDVDYANANWKIYADANTIFTENCDDLVYVPDNLFEQKLIDLGYDDVLDDYILKSNVENVTSLNLDNINIDILTGLEAFINLENLSIIDLSIDVLDVSKNTKLKVLNCSDNLLGSLDLTKNVDLEELYAGTNRFSVLDFFNNINLKKVKLIYNYQLINLDFSNNPLLEELEVITSSISDINITNCTLLEKIDFQNNQLSTIDVSDNVALKSINLSKNYLTSLNLKTNEQLQFLTISENYLNCVSVFDVDYANTNWKDNADENVIFVENCSDLIYIPDNNFEQALIDLGYDDVLDNYVLAINIENATSLQILEKEISDLTGIEGFINLEYLHFGGNNVSNVDISKNINLKTLICGVNPIYYVDVSNNLQLTDLVISNTLMSFVDLQNNTKLKNFTAFSSQLSYLDLRFNLELESLILDNNHINSLDITNNTKLKILNIGRNNFNTINLSKNILLTELNVAQNNFSTLDISKNFRITNFKSRNNNLTCINVWDVAYANANWSTEIDATTSFGDNCYTYIPDDNFEAALINLGLDTQIDDYVLTANISNIETLLLDGKFIADATGIESFVSLKDLSFKGNELTNIDLSNNTQLVKLIISNNKLDRLDISNNTLLEEFDALNNELTCIKVWNVNFATNSWTDFVDPNVTFSLDCGDVWTVEVDEKTETILLTIAGLDKNNDGEITLNEAAEFIGELDLSSQQLEDIKGLQAFSGITKLNLSNNDIKDLSELTGKKIILINKSTGKKREVEAKTSGLQTLIVSNNSFETLNLEDLTSLKEIDVSNNPNLVTLSIKNGANENITNFDATNTPNLTCILVDDKNAAYLTTWTKDEKSNFVADLEECRTQALSTDDFLQKDVNVFPNPVSNFLTIESIKEFDFIEIYNTIGKRILKTTERKIDFSSFTSGIYLLRIISDNKVLTKKVIKN
jgi:Leucine-rich repeat (LRR) protein